MGLDIGWDDMRWCLARPGTALVMGQGCIYFFLPTFFLRPRYRTNVVIVLRRT